jgi:hypothetical protein
MVINVNDHGIFPTGQLTTDLWLWGNFRADPPPPPDRTDVPVWLALQILINRASYTGGTVYLPGHNQQQQTFFSTGAPSPYDQRLYPSYNLGDHHLVIPSNVELLGSQSGGEYVDMDENLFTMGGIVNEPRTPHAGKEEWEFMNDGAWGPGSPGPHIPPDGYIIATIRLQGGGEWTVHVPFHHF